MPVLEDPDYLARFDEYTEPATTDEDYLPDADDYPEHGGSDSVLARHGGAYY